MGQTQICQLCYKEFELTNKGLAFYAKINVPPPQFCPDDRQRRRAAFRNERNLYKRVCDGTGKNIVTMYSEDKPFPVFDQEYWWGDSWSPYDYGRDFDFSRGFFEQFRELQLKVPRISLWNYNSQNSYYTNHAGDNKNCYMGTDLLLCEDVYFSNWVTHCKDCIDCSYTYKSQLCYQCLYCENCFNCDFCQECNECMDCSFCYDLKGCNNCFACAGLRNKKYHILNKQVAPEEYEKFVRRYKYSYRSQQEAWGKFLNIRANVPHKYALIIDSENCTGDYIYHCKNATNCYDAIRLWDCEYCFNTLDVKNGYDTYQPGFAASELVYEMHGGNTIFNCKFLNICRNVNDSEYSDQCFYSENLFGCVGIKRGKSCILNKQYKKDEYEELKARIVKHMRETGEYGEFFPMQCSPFGYNETKANEYYPVATKEEAQRIEANWSSYVPPVPTGENIDPPDDIRQVDKNILNKIIICEKTNRPFKIIEQEFNFYKQKSLPIPRKSPQKRYEERMALRNPRRLWNKACDKCGTVVKTTYAPDRPEKIYCEKCYLESVY